MRVINVLRGRSGRWATIDPVPLLLCPTCDRHYGRFFNGFFLTVALLIVGLLVLIGVM